MTDLTDKDASCIACDWSGNACEGVLHDYGDLATDSMCDGQGGYLVECPECGEPCEVSNG